MRSYRLLKYLVDLPRRLKATGCFFSRLTAVWFPNLRSRFPHFSPPNRQRRTCSVSRPERRRSQRAGRRCSPGRLWRQRWRSPSWSSGSSPPASPAASRSLCRESSSPSKVGRNNKTARPPRKIHTSHHLGRRPDLRWCRAFSALMHNKWFIIKGLAGGGAGAA